METTTAVAKAKLSCNHVQEVGPSVNAGDRVTCERCTKPGAEPRQRRVKKLTPLADMAPAAEVQAAEARIAELVEDHKARGYHEATAETMAEADAAVEAQLAEPDAIAIDTVGNVADGQVQGYDVAQASAEWKALKTWRDGGEQGERPSTVNLDAMNAAHAAGTPRPKVGRRQSADRKPRTSARRAEANAKQAEIGFEGRKQAGVVKWSDDELSAWMRQVAEAHPGTRKEDELEQCYWIERVAVSRKRFYSVWEATFGS